MKVAINNITVGQRKRAVVPQKVRELADSIKERGLMQLIAVTPDYRLIFGLHRLEAVKSLGWREVEVKILDLSDFDAELAEIDENLIRNDLHYIERGEQLKRRKEIYEARYPETRKGQYGHKGNKTIKAESEIISFSEDTAQKANFSQRTIQHEIQIADNLAPEVKEVVIEKEISKTEALKLARKPPEEQRQIITKLTPNTKVDRIAREIKKEKLREANQKLVEQVKPLSSIPGKFKTILIDPPWDWNDEGEEQGDVFGKAKPTYNTIPFEELLELPVNEKAEDNAHIYLWITNRSLPKGFKLLEAWGFRYTTCITWHKPSFGLGTYFRGQTEHVLFGVRGSLPSLRNDVGTVFSAPKGRHSEKPDQFYEIVESCSPGPWLEMFARKKRNGWTGWGAEV